MRLTRRIEGALPRRLRLLARVAFIAAVLFLGLRFIGSPSDGNGPPAPGRSQSHAERDSASTRNIALIFDDHRAEYAVQLIRSALIYGGSVQDLRFHLIAPPAVARSVTPTLDQLNVVVRWHDYSLCEHLVAPLRPFAVETIHTSALCKVFLADILVDVDRVLYIDTDATVVGDLSVCTQELPPDALFGMSIDMGEVCQIWPERCWPLSLEFVPWKGLVCGNVPRLHWPPTFEAKGAVCSVDGQPEPAQVNGGVILMELARMREVSFIVKLLDTTSRAFLLAGRQRATWAEQEFLNSYIREWPEEFSMLPCGCNYQYAGMRREVKCAGQPVHIVHHWSGNAARETDEPYNRIFHHLRRNDPGPLPVLPQLSSSSRFSPSGPVPIELNYDCIGQPYNCSSPAPLTRWGDPVFILTRTAGRPRYFAAARQSVLDQSYPYIRHLVATDDPASMVYLDGTGAELVVPAQHSARRAFDPDEVCRKCDHLNEPDRKCGRAPDIGNPLRQPYLECYCSTYYPMNELVNHLLRSVKDQHEAGWILILDDDNVLNSTSAISDLMLDVEGTDQLVLFQSRLGRLTPTDEAMYQPHVSRGDIDASNFLVHTSHIADAMWDAKRCGDWRTIDRLSRILDIKWSSTIPISAHPQRAPVGGLGARHDLPDPKPETPSAPELKPVPGPRWVEVGQAGVVDDDEIDSEEED